MKKTEARDRIEDFLDGRLEEDEATAFEERLLREPDLAAELELAERIRSSLRRSFVPPGSPALDSAPVPASSPVSAPATHRRRIAALLTAAAVLLLLLHLRPPLDRTPSTQLARREPTARRLPPVGPLETADASGLAPSVRAPDLERLYAEAMAGSEGSSMTCGPADDLGGKLAASYGERVTLLPEADQMLSGPFASEEWPTGTILRGAGASPAVLVAESDATARCCVQLELPPGSELHLFTWQLGGLVLTEITPLDEPRLLGYFE